MRTHAAAVLHRCGDHPCPPSGCEKDKLHRTARTDRSTPVPRSVHDTLATPGHALDQPVRRTMESRFGADFSDVRIHTDPTAAQSATAVGAHAYTVANHIVFAPHRYDPHTPTGTRTLAHELTHVLQQRGTTAARRQPLEISHPTDPDELAADAIADRITQGQTVGADPASTPGPIQREAFPLQRAVSPESVCPPGKAGATMAAPPPLSTWGLFEPEPPKAQITPLKQLEIANTRAVQMALGAALLLVIESGLIQAGRNDISTKAFDSYRRRFGVPREVGTKFRNRFKGELLPTLAGAQAAEMDFLAQKLLRIGTFLNGQIVFKCTDGFEKVGNCSGYDCKRGAAMSTCPGSHTIVVCPAFWAQSIDADQRAVGIIHEGAHMILFVGDHDHPDARSFAQRSWEAECFASVAADIYGVTSFDRSCPAI